MLVPHVPFVPYTALFKKLDELEKEAKGSSREAVNSIPSSAVLSSSMLREDDLANIVPSRKEVKKRLAKELNISYEEVGNGTIVEQALVDMTGIKAQQINPKFHCNKED